MEANDARYFAHPTAIVDKAAHIGDGTKIWHFSHVMRDAWVGERCNLGQNVVISPNCRVGNGSKIQNNVSVYTGVILEDEVFLGPSMVFTNVFNPRAFIERKDEYRETRVRRGASIGANATILCGVTLGEYCLVGAGAMVTRDIPAYRVAYGNPARVHGYVCWCGTLLEETPAPASLDCARCSRSWRREGDTLVAG